MSNTVYITSLTDLFLTSTLYNGDFPEIHGPEIKLFANEYDAVQDIQNDVENTIGYAEEFCNDLDCCHAWIVLSSGKSKTVLVKDDCGRFHGPASDFLSQMFNTLPQDSTEIYLSFDVYDTDITNRLNSLPRTVDDGLLFHSEFALSPKNVN